MTPIERITERVNRYGDPNDQETPRPLLTLQEFFDGNDISGSIGCNLDPMPEPRQFHEMLLRISSRPEVGDVRIQITMFDDPAWPFSDTVWIFTSATPEAVASWFPEKWRPDDIQGGWTAGAKYENVIVPTGMSPVACWWD
jgi:hypothetical protein